jgi:hypothetical protein
MTDQTPQDQPAAANKDFLSDSDRRKLEHLTAKGDSRFRADAQNQALLERVKHWFRMLFMRQDHGRWRISKTKGMAYITLAAATLAFWNYYPRPHLETAIGAPSLPIGSSVIAPPAVPAAATPVTTATPTRATQPLGQRPEVSVTAPPKLPVPRLEAGPPIPTFKNESMPSSTASYNPYQTEPINQVASPPRVAVQPPPSVAGLGDGLEVDGTQFPSLGAIPETGNSKSRVAPAPTALVKGKSVWNLTPEPLIERGKTGVVTPLETELPSSDSRDIEPLATVGPDAHAARIPAPLVNVREENNSLGQAGVLVDAGASGKELNGTSSGANLGQANGVLFNATQASGVSSSNPGIPSSRTTSRITEQTVAKAASLFEPGARVGAKLIVGVIAVQGQESPVVAHLEGGAIAFGKASLNPSGRVQLTLLEVVKDGVPSPVNASALGADGFPGLSVELREDSPDVVGKLWQAGLQGVSSYAQNVLEGATTTIANDATSVTQPQANLGLSLLQSLAQAFLTPPNQTTVKYARFEPQTAFEVLFMPTK